MRKIALLLALIMLAMAALTGCGSSTPGGSSTPAPDATGEAPGAGEENQVDFSKLVQVKGSDTMVNLGQQWAEAFMGEYEEAQIAVTGGGSGTGIAALLNGTADIAQSSRSIKQEEVDEGKTKGLEIQEIVAGMDGIAMVVNNENTVQELTLANLKDIFTGTITNWKDLGGADAPITIYSRESNSGTYAFVKEFVLKNEEYSQDALLMPSTGAIVEGVKQDVNGIGYIGLGYLSDEIKPVPVSKEAGQTAILPSLATVVDGTYPVARELFLYVGNEPEGVLALYVDYILGDAGQAIVEELGFIPVK